MQGRPLPPQRVLEMAWQEIREAAEACAPADGDSHVEPRQLAMQHCDDISCWQAGAADQAADESASDACAAAESCDVAAGDQCGDACSQHTSAGAEHVTEDGEWLFNEDRLVQCAPDSSADDVSFCTVGGDDEFDDIEEGVSMLGVAFPLFMFALLTIVYICHQVGHITAPRQRSFAPV